MPDYSKAPELLRTEELADPFPKLGPHRRPVAPAQLSWSLEQPGIIPGMVSRVTATAGTHTNIQEGRDHNCVTAQGFLCSESLSGSTSLSSSYCCTTQLLLSPGSLPQKTWHEETSLTEFAL